MLKNNNNGKRVMPFINLLPSHVRNWNQKMFLWFLFVVNKLL